MSKPTTHNNISTTIQVTRIKFDNIWWTQKWYYSKKKKEIPPKKIWLNENEKEFRFVDDMHTPHFIYGTSNIYYSLKDTNYAKERVPIDTMQQYLGLEKIGENLKTTQIIYKENKPWIIIEGSIPQIEVIPHHMRSRSRLPKEEEEFEKTPHIDEEVLEVRHETKRLFHSLSHVFNS